MTLLSGLSVPFFCLQVILLNAFSLVIKKPQPVLGMSVALIGCQSIPLCRCFKILSRYSKTKFVCRPTIVLCLVISSLCSLSKPLDSFFEVLCKAFALKIHETQIMLSYRKTLFSCLCVPFNCLFIISTNTFTFLIHLPQVVLGISSPSF